VHATRVLHSRLKRAAAFACAALLAVASLAADPRFEIRNACVEPVAGIWQLNAIVDMGLSKPAREALAEGIPLTLVVDISITGERRFLPDEDVAELQQRRELAYDALSDRYVVTNLNSGAQTTYSTQGEALESLSRIRSLPLIDADLLEAGRRHEVSLRASVEIGGLPGAVKMMIFWRDWSRSTNWYTWSIRP
jgi:hypothetical protein